MRNDTAAGRRAERLKQDALRYAWWLGERSNWLRRLLPLAGWRGAKWLESALGRPSGALAWPLGLALLCTNSRVSRRDNDWISACLGQVVTARGIANKRAISPDLGGLVYAALGRFEQSSDACLLAASRQFGDAMLARQGAESGTVPYSPTRSEVLVDTIAFMCPALARLSRLTGDSTYADLACRQVETFWQWGHAEIDWVPHGFGGRADMEIGLRGWGRGNAWLLLGLIDTMLELPPGHQQRELAIQCIIVLHRFADHQCENGHWRWLLTDRSARVDSSVTALVRYAALRIRPDEPANNSWLLSMIDRATAALDLATGSNGSVGQCSGEVITVGTYSENFGHFMWAQAPAVAGDYLLAQRVSTDACDLSDASFDS